MTDSKKKMKRIMKWSIILLVPSLAILVIAFLETPSDTRIHAEIRRSRASLTVERSAQPRPRQRQSKAEKFMSRVTAGIVGPDITGSTDNADDTGNSTLTAASVVSFATSIVSLLSMLTMTAIAIIKEWRERRAKKAEQTLV